MIVDPGTRARQHRKKRAVDLDPGSKVVAKQVEYGDKFAEAVRAILAGHRRDAAEAKPVEAVVDPFGLLIESGQDTPPEPHERSTPHG